MEAKIRALKRVRMVFDKLIWELRRLEGTQRIPISISYGKAAARDGACA